MDIKLGKLSNYIGQMRQDNRQHLYWSSVDKDLQNIWLYLKDLIAFFPGFNYNDINIGSVTLGTDASAPGNVTISSTNIVVRGFDGNVTTEQLYGEVEVMHGYEEGSNISPHVHWCPTTSGVGNVKWQMEYTIFKNDGTVSATSTTLSVNSSASGIAWAGTVATFPIISGTNITIEDQIAFRFFRDPTDGADNYADDAAVLTIGFHYKQNTLGSETISAK